MRMNRLTTQEIENNCHMENELRRIYNTYMPLILAEYKKMEGKKAILSTGDKSKKLEDSIKDIIESARKESIKPLTGTKHASVSMFYVNVSYSSLWLKIGLCFEGKPCIGGGYIAEYHENSYYISDFNKDTGALENMKDFKPFDFVNKDEQIKYYTEATKAVEFAESLNDKLIHKNRAFSV